MVDKAKAVIAGIGVLGSIASIVATGAMFMGDEPAPPPAQPEPAGAMETATPTPTPTPEPTQAPLPLPQPQVPPISELLYSEARELLLRSGFRPARSPMNPTGQPQYRYGNGAYAIEQNWLEVRDCSGTGLAPCLFAFKSSDDRILALTTVGEAPNMRVNDWWWVDDPSDL